jgi:hypothetical protein
VAGKILSLSDCAPNEFSQRLDCAGVHQPRSLPPGSLVWGKIKTSSRKMTTVLYCTVDFDGSPTDSPLTQTLPLSCFQSSSSIAQTFMAAVVFLAGVVTGDSIPTPCGIYTGCTPLVGGNITISDNITMTVCDVVCVCVCACVTMHVCVCVCPTPRGVILLPK